jgi:hypothetical protein
MISDLTSQSVSYDSNPRIEVAFETDRTIGGKNIDEQDIIKALTVSFNNIKESIHLSNSQNLIDLTIQKLNNTIEMDKEYLDNEGVNLPNEKARNYAIMLIEKLGEKSIVPTKISTLADEGISFNFKNKSQNMFFEIYNDGDVGYIVEDTLLKKVLDNKDCYSFTDAIDGIERFYI